MVIAGSVSGTGDESVNGIVTFDPHQVYNKSALLLLNGVIYVSFGSHCDYSPWHGWVFAYDENSFAQKSIFATSPNSGESGIWMSGAGPAADSNGYIYLATGNGTFDTAPPVTDYGDTLLKLSTVDSQGNNGILSVADYFTPYNQQIMSQTNQELGAGGVLLLPDQPGAYPYVLVQAAKTGVIYFLNRDRGRAIRPVPERRNTIARPAPAGTRRSSRNRAALYQRSFWSAGVLEWPRLFLGHHEPADVDPAIQRPSEPGGSHEGAISPGFPGGMPSVSSNGNTTGTAIVWATTKTGTYAYNAENISQLLWSSLEGPNGRDLGGTYVKYRLRRSSTRRCTSGRIRKSMSMASSVIKPLNVTLGPGQVQQFTSLPGVTWSISPTGAGGISSTGLYTAPAVIAAAQTVTVTAMNTTGTTATAAIALVPSAAGASAATFLQYDSTTQGSWIGTYGADGYSLAGGNQLLPSYDPRLLRRTHPVGLGLTRRRIQEHWRQTAREAGLRRRGTQPQRLVSTST